MDSDEHDNLEPARPRAGDSTRRDIYRAAIHGDREAFEMIIQDFSRPLFAIAYGILQDRQDAEDAVQDAFLKAWKSRWRVRDPEKFPAWLATIARHRARDLARKRKPVHDLEGNAPSFPLCSTESDNPHKFESAAVHRHLLEALGSLPEEHRAALTLRYFEEMDYASIEKLLGLSNGALRGILGRALGTLRKQLRPALAQLD